MTKRISTPAGARGRGAFPHQDALQDRPGEDSSGIDLLKGASRLLGHACLAGSVLFLGLFILLLYAVAAGDTDTLAEVSLWMPAVGLPVLAGLAMLCLLGDPKS